MEPGQGTIVSRYSLSQQVRNHILNRIATGELAPGDKVVEARVAGELHVSTIPVREAIRELAAIRVLDYSMHRGARVRQVTVGETVDALYVKAVLEALSARLAGARLREHLSLLRQYSSRLLDCAIRRDWVEYQNQNQLFHRLIVAASGNQILLTLWDSLAFQVRTRFIMDYLHIVDPYDLAKEHDDVIQAIEAQDTEKTASLLNSHASRLVDYLKEQQAAEKEGAAG